MYSADDGIVLLSCWPFVRLSGLILPGYFMSGLNNLILLDVIVCPSVTLQCRDRICEWHYRSRGAAANVH